MVASDGSSQDQSMNVENALVRVHYSKILGLSKQVVLIYNTVANEIEVEFPWPNTKLHDNISTITVFKVK